ncbi:MAG: UV DNA damage repair endonuclease UvsE [Candidatus Micrarchaeia archaeon]
MKIGYPCINNSIGCTANSTFRLANYSEENMKEKISNNLSCLKKILEYNVKNELLFFRISSDIVPFASHPICKFDWQKYFSKEFKAIGKYIKEKNIRISMHPDQFVLINAKDKRIIESSIRELNYHCDVLDLMGLDSTAKVQIHVGGVYGNKEESIQRFIENYKKLPNKIKKRLVIENDERNYSLKDCVAIYQETGIPVLFDSFHHLCFNNGETRRKGVEIAMETWKEKDGILMTDYSSQEKNAKIGTHARHIDINDFKRYIEETKNLDFDIMLEIKDKEKSALKAKKLIYY